MSSAALVIGSLTLKVKNWHNQEKFLIYVFSVSVDYDDDKDLSSLSSHDTVGKYINPTNTYTFANSENPDKMAHNEPSCYWLLTKTPTVLDLISAHTPISAQSSNSAVLKLQPVCFFVKAYVVGTHLNCIDLWVLIWIASTSRCNSNEYPQHMF